MKILDIKYVGPEYTCNICFQEKNYKDIKIN